MSSTSYKTPELICMRKMQDSLYSYTRDDKSHTFIQHSTSYPQNFVKFYSPIVCHKIP